MCSHLRFDRYYAERCQRLGVSVDGPLPDNADDHVANATSPTA